jgi:hypothetical protein
MKGEVTTICNESHIRGFQDGLPAQASLHSPHSICSLYDGSLVLTDCANNRLRRLVQSANNDWACTTIGGGDCWLNPKGVCCADGGKSLVVCDSGHNRLRMVTLDVEGAVGGCTVAAMAGSGRSGYRDGPADTAMFNNLSGVCMAQDGSLIIADTGDNHRDLKPTTMCHS